MNPAIIEFRDHLTQLKHAHRHEGRKLRGVRVPVLVYRMLKSSMDEESEVYAVEAGPDAHMLVVGIRVEPDSDIPSMEPEIA